MVYTEPDSVWHLTPIDRKRLFSKQVSFPPTSDRYKFTLNSQIFDERYTVSFFNGYLPRFSPVETTYDYSKKPYILDSIFSNFVHESIARVFNFNQGGGGLYADEIYGDLSLENIEKSLVPNLRKAFNSFSHLDGRSAKLDCLLAVQSSLVRNEINNFDAASFSKSVYNDVQSKYKSGNKLEDENLAMEMVRTKAVNLDFNYLGPHSERLKYWRTIPGDVNKRLIVYDVNQTAHTCPISTDDTLHVNDSSKDSYKVHYGAGDVLSIGETSVNLASDIETAKVLNISDSVKVLNLMGIEAYTTLEVVTDQSSSIELNPTSDTGRSAYTILSLSPETVEERDTNNSLIKITKATYKLNSNIDEDLTSKAFPHAVLPILNDDTILDYLDSKEEATLTFTDFNLSLFLNPSENIVRRIPQYIIIIPTDKTEHVPFHAKSRMSTYGTRSLSFISSPEEVKHKESMLRPKHLTYTSSDNTYTFNNSSVLDKDNYALKEEQLPRKTSSIYKALLVLLELSSNYGTLSDRTALFELFYRLSPSDLHSLRLDLTDFEAFKYKLMQQTLSDEVLVALTYPKMGEVFREYDAQTVLSYAGEGVEPYPTLNCYNQLLSYREVR